MASRLIARERRSGPRIAPEAENIAPLAILRPGREVVVLDLSARGALIESATRLAPGTRAELQLFGMRRGRLRGHVGRCRVSRLDPLRYEGAIVFDVPLDIRRDADHHG